MSDTGEGREIKARTDAKEAEIVAEAKTLSQKLMATKDQMLHKRGRVNKKTTLPTTSQPQMLE